MSIRTITIHDRCQKCNRTLRSIQEGERGKCAACWVLEMPADTIGSLTRLIATALKSSTQAERDSAVQDAMEKIKRDELQAQPPEPEIQRLADDGCPLANTHS